AITRLALSARGYHRILKIARTLADLEGAADLQPKHVSEAIQYRSLDRRGLGLGRLALPARTAPLTLRTASYTCLRRPPQRSREPPRHPKRDRRSRLHPASRPWA